MDLKENVFKKRILHTHYITQFIKRDYEQSTTEQKNKIFKIISKTYPNKNDLDCILLNLGSAISGNSKSDQTTLFLLGDGSSGKSGIMLLTLACIECYFKELQNNTFAQGNPKIDKILNTFAKSPYIRIMWVNEMKDLNLMKHYSKVFVKVIFKQQNYMKMDSLIFHIMVNALLQQI